MTDKKVKVSPDCKNGKHVFVATIWDTKGQKHQATEMRCQHCLIPVSLEEIQMNEWRKAEGLDSNE